MANSIHPTAVVDPAATLGDSVTVGPYSVVGANVTLGDDVFLYSHVVIEGDTVIGHGSRIFPFASIGHIPQDLKFHGEDSRLEIGQSCTIREHVTISPGTSGGGGVTRIGNNCLIMIGVHIGHDCQIGNHVILVNNTILGGHVEIDDHAILGGTSAVLQFVRIGAHAFVGGMTGVDQDIIPFGMVVGDRGYLNGLNLTGLKRRGFERNEINSLREAYRMLFESDGEMADKIEAVDQQFGEVEPVQELLSFLRSTGRGGIVKPRPAKAG